MAQTTPTPTPSPTRTPTATVSSNQSSVTLTATHTPTPTHTATSANTATRTTSALATSNTPTPTYTATPTNSATRTITSASTSTSTSTLSRTPTSTSTPTLLVTPNGFIPPLSTLNPLRVAPPAQPNRIPLAPNALSAASGSVRGDWQFDGNLNDSSGNGNNGIDYLPPNSASYTQGIAGSGLVRDGNLLPIQLINNTNSLIMTDKISIEAWVKSSDYGGGFRHIIDNTDGYALSILNGGVAMLGPGFWWTPNVPPLSLNQWHYVVGTYDIATGYQALYVDGQLVIDRYIPDGIPGGSGQVAIGGWGLLGSAYLFNGVIDNVRVTNGALTAAEVAANYAALNIPTPSPTLTFTSTPSPTPTPTPTQATYTIEGRITNVLNAPIKDVAISGFGIVTDANGFYSVTVSSGGVYQLIPSKAGFKFVPQS
ncbi:MAG: LamG-like jellyroll fold domain-containing protein, partial [Chloroflexota bacterium]